MNQKQDNQQPIFLLIYSPITYSLVIKSHVDRFLGFAAAIFLHHVENLKLFAETLGFNGTSVH